MGYGVAFSKDDQKVALGYFDGGMEYRTTVGGELIWKLEGLTRNWVNTIEFINEDKEIIALAPRKMLLVNTAEGTYSVLKKTLDNNQHYEDFDLNADETKLILVRSSSYRVNQYSFPKLKPLYAQEKVASSPPEMILFSPGGQA